MIIIISLQLYDKGALLHFNNFTRKTSCWVVLVISVVEPPALPSSLKALTGLTAGEKFSKSTGVLDLVISVWEISWGCIIHESDYGSPCIKFMAANYHVHPPIQYFGFHHPHSWYH